MTVHEPPQSSAARVRAHRERLRAKGLKPVQIWLPDVNSAKFKAQVRRFCKARNESQDAKNVQAFLDAMYDELAADDEFYGPPAEFGE